MGTKERRRREIADLKEKIIKATRNLARNQGWEAVTVRAIADEVDYTPPVLYEYFNNKEGVLKALEALGFDQLKEALEATRRVGKSAGERLLIQAQAYWEFAMEHRDLYQVMFHLEGVHCSADDPEALKHAGQPVIDTIREAKLFSGDIDGSFFQWWGIAHGFVALAHSGHLPGQDHKLKYAMEQAIQRLIKELGE